jgi:hypothetical protein
MLTSRGHGRRWTWPWCVARVFAPWGGLRVVLASHIHGRRWTWPWCVARVFAPWGGLRVVLASHIHGRRWTWPWCVARVFAPGGGRGAAGCSSLSCAWAAVDVGHVWGTHPPNTYYILRMHARRSRATRRFCRESAGRPAAQAGRGACGGCQGGQVERTVVLASEMCRSTVPHILKSIFWQSAVR